MASENRVEVVFDDGRVACFSYGVPVAAYIPRDWAAQHNSKAYGWICTSSRYSVTTSRHMNYWANPANRTEVTDACLRKLISPVQRAK